MNKKYFISSIVIFIAWMAGSFLIHEILLGSEYESVAHLYRSNTDMESKTIWMMIAHILMAFAFVWIFLRGLAKGPYLSQGFRFGLAITLLAVLPMYMIYYVIMPLPESLVLKQIIFDGLLTMSLAIILSFIYRKETE